MKKLFLLVLLAFLGSVWVAGKIQEDPGYLLLSFKNTTIEMSLWMGLAFIIGCVVVVLLLIWALGKLMGSGKTLKRWNNNLQHRRTLNKTNAGVIAYLEGNWTQAQKKLDQASENSETPLVSFVTAAKAAVKNGDYSASDRYLRKAAEEVPGARLALELAKTQIQIDAGRHEQALAALLQMRQSQPKHKEVCRQLQKVYVALEDWEALRQLMPVLRKLKVAPAAELDEVERNTAISLLDRAVRELPKGTDSDKIAAQLGQVWKKIQPKVRRHSSVTLAYSGQLRKIDRAELAVTALAESISTEWDDALVETYGLIEGEDTQQQLLAAERWIKERNNNPVLMLALGRLSIRNKLWGKAKEYLVSSLKLKKSVIVYAELARLANYLGDEQGSADLLKEGFELMTEDLPALPKPSPAQASISKIAG